MAINNPKGRVNYEPNSWGALGGPRECPERGFRSFPAEIRGEKARHRSPSFADHYSQARLFYVSQTPVEQKHVRDALVFELSKCERADIRSRVVSHLLNIDTGLAKGVAAALRIDLPEAARAARPTRVNLPPSDQLSILKRPTSFAGRKLGVLITEGADADILHALLEAVESAAASFELIAPHIGGAVLSNGELCPASQQIDGGPSVLYDAVAILASDAGGRALAKMPASRDFVADAFTHCKFMGFTAGALTLLKKAGIADELDDGCILLTSAGEAAAFVKRCAQLRRWERELELARP